MAKAHVLIVEDDGIVAIDIQSRLESLGFDVSGIVSSGKEAICMAKEADPDIVLMDIPYYYILCSIPSNNLWAQ